jgi:DNA ligase D-like protein (predicted polymerase)
MLVRKNTKAFKTILQIVSDCQSRPDREQLIRLFITRAGNTVKDRISVDSIQGDSALFYEMNYQTVLNSLRSSNHQLNESDEIPGLFFFHSSSNKSWDETPFEFDEAVAKEFGTLPDLPTLRKKEKYEKFVLPTASPAPKGQAKTAPKVSKAKAKKVAAQGPKQPDFELKHHIDFTNLERIIFRQPVLNKEQILNYYNSVSKYLLPYLKDRHCWVRVSPDVSRPMQELTVQSLFSDELDIVPNWLSKRSGKKNSPPDALIAHDKEHLLLFVERGAIEFHPQHCRERQHEHPDYILITIDSPESNIEKAVEVAQQMKTVFDALKLPLFVKTNSTSRLDVYVPLDAKGPADQSKACASHLCKLVRLKIPNLVAVATSDESDYGKVSLDYTLNENGQTAVAPYSLVAGETVTVATPLEWDEVNEELDPASFNPNTIFQRLKKVGDPFENFYKKRINATDLLKRLEENYAFLF